MQNPWMELPDSPPFVLPFDKPFIDLYNKKVNEDYFIHLDLRPEPFIGSNEAKIILLNQNPSFSLEDYPFYKDHKVVDLWKKNIYHQDLKHPFYFLDPQIAHLMGGPNWWQKRLKMMIDEFGLETVSNNISCLEFFGYHSRHLNINLLRRVPSQKYCFFLVEEAIKRNAVIILIRGENFWRRAVPSLINYSNYFKLNSSQAAYITRNNCPKGYELFSKLLKIRAIE